MSGGNQDTMKLVMELLRDMRKGIKSNSQRYLAFLGLLYCGKIAGGLSVRLCEAFRVHFLARFWKTDLKIYGRWALVTGCSDGIGREYARALASRGINIVLVARSQEKLETLKLELEYTHNVLTRVVVADLARGAEVFSEIRSQIEDLEIGILVNNAGVMYDQPSRFCDVPLKKLEEHITVNMQAVMMLTFMVLPQMLRRKKGLIVNMSSLSAFYPLPYMSVYSASKGFVDLFSQALAVEYGSQGIEVQTLTPSYVSTNLVKFSDVLSTPSFVVPDAKTFVDSAISTVGYTRRTTGYWSHGLQYWAMEHIPQWLWTMQSDTFFKAIDSSADKKL
ncbi:inactive hydroxysteroid dehydrogenase-like protein 1 [Galendromus occidentalis]|uniref:Inactive hydroxysteroid dehydrogenase-like protein 1 n=1 Tax=Galendromus occidentalis TaxID=34638 RepID=A0AAJ7P9W4_9ACAR|nr:inactive hydroxysteroid dehydrogenase-like protein 1 [Galendromus occidentalis]